MAALAVIYRVVKSKTEQPEEMWRPRTELVSFGHQGTERIRTD